MIKRILHLVIFIFISKGSLFATHNRAGEISFVQISDLAIRVVVTTYTKTSSVAADRDSLIIDWGDGSFSTIARSNGNGEPLPNNVKRNYYSAEHTFPGRGTYNLSVADPNRVENILNIDPPNSVNIPFYIQTTVTLLNLQFQYPNHSVKLLQPPIDFGCVGQLFIHNPSAYDEDGDSLSFELIVPLMDKNTPVPNYSYPNQIQSGLNNNISFDKNLGTFTWNAPQRPGEYNIAFIIHEYRKGVKIASTIRDMQIFVRNDCNTNHPPTITAISDTCIVAGSNLKLDILATDIDSIGLGSKIKIEAIGAPFFTNPAATISVQTIYSSSPIRASILWKTDCSLIRKEYYTLVVKVTDNYLDTTGLSYLHTIRIKIVGPAPENLISDSKTNKIELFWDKPYECDTNTVLFRGFSVWRREGPRFLMHDTCNPGLENKGYQQIAYLVSKSQGNQYTYIDSLIVKGKFYCYRVLGEFARISSQGFPVNFVSSLHSNETCNSIAVENPLLLNADVLNTDSLNGIVFTKWLKPEPEIFDTVKNPPPYQTIVTHRTNNSNWMTIPSSLKNFSRYSNILDTTFQHTGINTKSEQHYYSINLKSANNSDHISDSSQTLFLSGAPSDQSVQLSWNAKTAWNNYLFTIYRFNNATQQFDSISQTDLYSFTDHNLVNSTEYCYLIKSYGEYGIQNIEHPLINHSNILCATPFDNLAPCCPVLTIKGPCDENQNPDPDQLINTLSWTNPNINCSSKDAVGYRIYSIQANAKKLIGEITDIHQTTFEHHLLETIPTCYQVTAFDSLQNECFNSDSVCVKYCPRYKLPNTFTPNGDNHNDLFKPYPFLFIDKIYMKIFNRWGNLVYTTVDPHINWDGTDLNGKKLSDGVYYYQCDVYYTGFQSNNFKNETITGFIEMLSGKN